MCIFIGIITCGIMIHMLTSVHMYLCTYINIYMCIIDMKSDKVPSKVTSSASDKSSTTAAGMYICNVYVCYHHNYN